VALRIAQTLASEADSTVGLVALWGASLGSLSSAFDIKLPIERIKNFFMFSSNSVREPSVNPLFSPYFGAVTLQLLRFVQRVIHKFHPDLIVFNDDSPRFISKLPSDTKTLVYAHFPYACRLRYDIPDSSSSKSIPRRVSDAFVRPFITRLFETECTGVTWLAANSNVTRRYMLPTFRREVSVIYPPI